MDLSLQIMNNKGEILAKNTSSQQVSLVYDREYNLGDYISLGTSERDTYLIIQLDDAMKPEFVYVKESEFEFTIPFEEKKFSYSPKSFSGQLHVLKARVATPEEIKAYRNLAANVYDHHENNSCYPHASANVETRGEAVFAARNAIDGNSVNYSHGKWPFESWGINRREDAEIMIDFGRTVVIDKIAITIRADFPHDNYWESAVLTFSDGSLHKIGLTKTPEPQYININNRRVEWVRLGELIKADDPSPFPALSQIEVFGHEV